MCIVRGAKRITNKNDKCIILNDFHILPIGGHAGIRRMVNNIKKYYFWPKLEADVIEFIKRCNKCKNKNIPHIILKNLCQ